MFPIRNIYQAVLFQRGNVFCLEPRVKTLSLHGNRFMPRPSAAHGSRARAGADRSGSTTGNGGVLTVAGWQGRAEQANPQKQLAPSGSKYRVAGGVYYRAP
jgi:hypothetical protein